MWLRMTSHQPLLPLWLSIAVIAVCLMFSALFSGLNLGLMSLDKTDLQVRFARVFVLHYHYHTYYHCSCPIDPVQYRQRQGKGIRQGHSTGSQARQLFAVQHSAR